MFHSWRWSSEKLKQTFVFLKNGGETVSRKPGQKSHGFFSALLDAANIFIHAAAWCFGLRFCEPEDVVDSGKARGQGQMRERIENFGARASHAKSVSKQ